MSEILYNFAANNSSLEDINSNYRDVQEVKDDIASIFATLMHYYQGEGAASLHQAQMHLNGMLEEALDTTAHTQRQAQEQQEVMQALDRANAASF